MIFKAISSGFGMEGLKLEWRTSSHNKKDVAVDDPETDIVDFARPRSAAFEKPDGSRLVVQVWSVRP